MPFVNARISRLCPVFSAVLEKYLQIAGNLYFPLAKHALIWYNALKFECRQEGRTMSYMLTKVLRVLLFSDGNCFFI